MKKFAVFDIDGTLIRWQLYHAVVNRLGNMGVLDKEFAIETKDARRRWKNRQSDTTFQDYEYIFVKRWMEKMNQVPYKIYMKAVDEIIDEYIDQVYIYTRDLIKQLKKDGYFLLAISGSPNEMVEKIAEHYGFDDFIGANFLVGDNGYFTGETNGPVLNKDTYLKKLVKKHNLSWTDSIAVGDTGSDIKMLKLVEKPIAFNPNHELVTAAQDNGWPIIIERKSVIYELNTNDWKIFNSKK